MSNPATMSDWCEARVCYHCRDWLFSSLAFPLMHALLGSLTTVDTRILSERLFHQFILVLSFFMEPVRERRENLQKNLNEV